MYLFRELDQRNLRDKERRRVAGLDGGAQHEAPHHVAVAADLLHRHVLAGLGALHPEKKHNAMRAIQE